MAAQRLIIGLVEEVVLEDKNTYSAKIDTGADSSSIDKGLLDTLGGERKIISHKVVRSALGRHKRPIVKLKIKFQGKEFEEKFTVSNRAHMRYKLLIGQDILKKEGFLIDPIKQIDLKSK